MAMSSSSVMKLAVIGLSCLAGLVSAFPTTNSPATTTTTTTTTTTNSSSNCHPLSNGTLVINQFQLYPENAKFDPVRCLVYIGALFNSSVAVFDPTTNTITRTITFPGLTGDATLHLGPALPDPSGRFLTVLFDAAAAFATGGADVSGSNVLLRYDLDADRVVWQRNLTADVTAGRFGGYQDVALDRAGNTYVVGTFPGTVLRVDANGTGPAVPWFLPSPARLANTTVAGFAGIAALPDRDALLVNDNADGQIYRFDAVSGTAAGKATPVLVPRTDAANRTAAASKPLGASDAILLPAKYGGKVLLVAEDATGATVLRSRDGSWTSAETLGTVANNVPAAAGGFASAVVQIGPQRLFTVEAFFTDMPIVPGTLAGNRTAFPMVDITAEVDALLAKFP